MISSLPTGFTDNRVTRVDGLVVKTGARVMEELLWYQAYQDKADIPYVMGEKDGSIVMKYIERSGEWQADQIINIVEKYSHYPKLNELPWTEYIKRINNHLQNNKAITNGNILEEKLHRIKLLPTFCHGDLSVYNIIPSASGVKLIDPLYSSDRFGSYILDYAKLLFSLKFYSNEMDRYHEFRDMVNIPFIDVLIASECVRVATYKKQFSFIAENLINEL